MTSKTSLPSLTLWTADFLLYPSRIEFYFHENPLPESANITRNYCQFSQEGHFIVPDGCELPPQGTIPSLRVRVPGENDQLIRESTAILEYFEEEFPRGHNMLGSSSLLRARNRDATSIMNDMTIFMGSWMYNVSEIGKPRLPWGQSEIAARSMRKRVHELLDKLESWSSEWHGERGWILGTEKPMTADCILLSIILFAQRFYGVDLLKGHDALQEWMKKWNGRGTMELQKSPPEWMSKIAKTVREDLS